MEHFHGHFSVLSFSERSLRLSSRSKNVQKRRELCFHRTSAQTDRISQLFLTTLLRRGRPPQTLQPLERSSAHSVYTRDPPPPLNGREARAAILFADWTEGGEGEAWDGGGARTHVRARTRARHFISVL